jgi:hypothetical protein
VSLPAQAAPCVAEHLAALTNGPADTRFWGPLQRTVAAARQVAAERALAEPDCGGLTDVSAEVNRIALSAYLQGFLDLAAEICERQLDALGASPCGCARLSELQPWVNLARLGRARESRAALAAAADGLERALAAAQVVDPSTLPHHLAEGLGDGSVLGAADHVATIETAKLEWLAGDHAECERLVAPIAPHSSGAMELTVRCMLATGRWADVIALAAGHGARFGWLPAYAAAALAAGGARDAAARVIASLRDDTPLPLLRLCVELRAAGCEDEARATARRVLASALASGSEVAALLAAALLAERGEAPGEPAAVDRVAAASWHHPAVAVHAAACGREPPAATVSAARAATVEAAGVALAVLRRLGPPARHRSGRGPR